MTAIDPASLGVFMAIARHGSFRRAAIELRVTPSALSHALRALEERIDLRLFNRTTRSVSLTEAGQRLFERAEPAFRDIEGAIDDLASFRGAPMGSLRINSSGAAAQLVLMPLIEKFLQQHPAVSVEILAQGGLADIVSQGFDAGVRFGETLQADMIAVPIGPRQRFIAVASPAYFEHWPKPVAPDDLTRLPCVRFRFESGADYHWEFERSGVELALKVDGPFATNSTELGIDAALRGIGIMFTFEGMVDDHVRAGRLVRVLDEWCPYFSGLYLYYPSRRQMPSALRAFVDFVKARPVA